MSRIELDDVRTYCARVYDADAPVMECTTLIV